MRLIDADARVTVQTFDEQHEEYDHIEMSVAEALDFATDEGCPPAVNTMTTWTYTKDQMPPDGKYVLAYLWDDYFVGYYGYYKPDGEYKWFFEDFDLAGDEIEDVKAWMYLPEPPEED